MTSFNSNEGGAVEGWSAEDLASLARWHGRLCEMGYPPEDSCGEQRPIEWWIFSPRAWCDAIGDQIEAMFDSWGDNASTLSRLRWRHDAGSRS